MPYTVRRAEKANLILPWTLGKDETRWNSYRCCLPPKVPDTYSKDQLSKNDVPNAVELEIRLVSSFDCISPEKLASDSGIRM